MQIIAGFKSGQSHAVRFFSCMFSYTDSRQKKLYPGEIKEMTFGYRRGASLIYCKCSPPPL